MRLSIMPQAVADLNALPVDVRRRIADKIEWYCAQRSPLVFAQRLSGDHRQGQYRFRVGDYRAIFQIDHDRMIILHVGHRREIYR